MTQQHKRKASVLGLIFILLFFFPILGKSKIGQYNNTSERVRESFDFNWLFHKGDIAIKNTVKGFI